MVYVKFMLVFTAAHLLSYLVAGAISLRSSPEIYEGKKRLCHFLRDMKEHEERKHVEKFFLPAQIIRALLMASVLLPLRRSLEALSIPLAFLFFASLMFVFTHLAAASPFIDNLEGQVYFKKEYIQKRSLVKFQLEMLIYSLLFGLMMTVGMQL